MPQFCFPIRQHIRGGLELFSTHPHEIGNEPQHLYNADKAMFASILSAIISKHTFD